VKILVHFFGGYWDGLSKAVMPTDRIDVVRSLPAMHTLDVGKDPDNAAIVGLHETYSIYQLAPDFFLGLNKGYSLQSAVIRLWDDHCGSPGTAANIRARVGSR